MARRKGKKKANIEYLVLYHLSKIGIIPKSDLSIYRGISRDCYVQQLIAKHIKAGHIKTIRYHSCSYCFVSESGIEYLCRQERDVFNHNPLIDEYQKFILSNLENKDSCFNQPHWEPSERKPTRKMNPQRRMKLERLTQGTRSNSFKAEVKKNSAMNLMYCADILVYPEDKPDFNTFLAILSQVSYKTTFLWSALSAHGMFYSREEMVVDNSGYEGRMLGVLFTKAGWYVVYNAYEDRSRWFGEMEAVSTGKLRSILRRLLPYRSSYPRSLVFSVGRGMVAAMVSGYKHGHNKTKKNLKGRADKWQKRLMTVETMKVIYEAVYLIELNGGGLSSLAWLIESDEKSIAAERQAFIDGNPGMFKLMPTESGQSIVMDIATGREIVIAQAYNLTMLKRLRDGNRDVDIIALPWMAEATSKSLGPRMGRFISLYGDGEIQVNRYDEYGEKLTPQSS